MQTRRRGGPAAPRAEARDSSQGRASATPAARRNVRRSKVMSASLVPEQRALDDLMDQRAEAVVLSADRGDDRVDLFPVGGLGRAARGIGEQLLRQGSGEAVLVLQEQPLELID